MNLIIFKQFFYEIIRNEYFVYIRSGAPPSYDLARFCSLCEPREYHFIFQLKYEKNILKTLIKYKKKENDKTLSITKTI